MAALAGSIARATRAALFAIGVDQRNFEDLGKQLEALTALVETRQPKYASRSPIPSSSHRKKRAILQGLMPRVAPTREVQSLAFLLLDAAASPPCPPSHAPTKKCAMRQVGTRPRHGEIGATRSTWPRKPKSDRFSN